MHPNADTPPYLRGGFAEYMYIRPKTHLFKVPEEMATDVAVFVEEMAVAYHSLGRASVPFAPVNEGFGPGMPVAVLGNGPLGLLQARDEDGAPLVKGRRITAVTNKQVEELGISVTPMHPERELRAAGAAFESSTAFRDFFANHVVVDGRLVTGQNQNAGAEVANLMMKAAGGTRR